MMVRRMKLVIYVLAIIFILSVRYMPVLAGFACTLLLVILIIADWIVDNYYRHRLAIEKVLVPRLTFLGIIRRIPERMRWDVGISRITLYENTLVIMHFSRHFNTTNRNRTHEVRDYETGVYTLNTVDRLNHSQKDIEKGRFAHIIRLDSSSEFTQTNSKQLRINYRDETGDMYELFVEPELWQSGKFLTFLELLRQNHK